ncbi:hypothetical protein C7974DRAFT_462528 [Boeremia exigua]|uniref:uncharacterized protein n=1 Tax=Boeremia exigua TaxID=749465 RepID=UPI001E8CC4F4|nr:uncharacterized protein C7974DRAFT_462528 [Boeremia exigua]KAH6638310.1 hypothetical protein C7974DRAFT_462528 [Boeremia exigua]
MTEYDDYGVPVGAYQEPDSFTGQTYRTARAFFLYRVKPLVARSVAQGRWKRVFSLANALVVVWWMAVYWGERAAFDSAVGSCNWDAWEDWEPGANPHRLVFVADPQLVDPHTYPGRPWPLNPLTIKYTDQYMRRAYSRIQTELYPDTVFFLGDLFDGGREWSTRTTKSPEKQYQRYGDSYWLNEYRRFGSIFFAHWGDGGTRPRAGQPGRKLITSLPGNHDLGFAKGVQLGVRDRFHAYFGDGNRIDIVGNHSFVSIDSVSLGALGVPSPHELKDIWGPTADFLATAQAQKRKLVQRELRRQQGLQPYPGFPHREIPTDQLAHSPLPHADTDVADFPTVLLTHVPLYRPPGTPCGPLRERSPPSPPAPGETSPPDPDPPNAISVSGGYQYQNVQTKDLSASLTSQIGHISAAFSGDDHDYCEVVHRGYASAGGGIREITVKSISWAMGVRRPGFVAVSLWNPVDARGAPLKGQGEKTLQTHLCLLPDQIGTFARYALLFALTLLLLAARAALVVARVLPAPAPPVSAPLLPTAVEKHAHAATSSAAGGASLSRRTASPADGGAYAGAGAGGYAYGNGNGNGNGYGYAPAPAPLPHHQSSAYTFPLVQHAGYTAALDADAHAQNDVDWDRSKTKKSKVYGSTTVRKTGAALFWAEMRGVSTTRHKSGLHVWRLAFGL